MLPEKRKDSVGEYEILFKSDTCPHCGSFRQAIGDTAREECAAGRFSTEWIERGYGITVQAPVVDPMKTVLLAPMIIKIDDFCLDCGLQYTKQIIRCKAEVTRERPLRGNPPINPFTLRGR